MPEQSSLEVILQIISFSFALWLGLLTYEIICHTNSINVSITLLKYNAI